MAEIVDQYGRPFKREVLSEPQTARLGWVSREWSEHPSRGLTPMKLHRILEAAERGDISAQADLFCDMEEKDAHIYAEISKRKRSLLTLDWSIQPPARASAQEKRDAEELEEWLRDMDDLEDVYLDALDGIGHGFAAQVITWERQDKFWLPGSIDHYAQRLFQTLPDDGNALRLRDGSVTGEELLPFGWIQHRHKAKTGYLTRAGLHRVLAWPYLFKNYSVRDLAEFLEIYGIPIRMGHYPVGSGKDEQATLLAAVAGIGHNAAGIMPEGMNIEIEAAAQGQHDPFMAMIDWAERSVSKAVLGGTLTSQADGKTSTNALGQVHNEVRHDLTVSDARQLSGTLSRDLVYPMHALNHSKVDARRRHRLVFDTRELDDLKTVSDSVPKLVAVGVRVPESWVREKLGIPEPVGDEPLLAVAAPSTAKVPAAELTTRSRAALTTVSAELDSALFPDQTILDAGIDTPPAALQTEVEALIKPVIEFLQAGGDAGDALTQIADVYPDMDSPGLEQLLARAIFVADMWGRINGAPTHAD